MRKRIGTNKMDETKQIGYEENWTGQGIRNATWTHTWTKNRILDEKIKELTWTKNDKSHNLGDRTET